MLATDQRCQTLISVGNGDRWNPSVISFAVALKKNSIFFAEDTLNKR